MLYKGNKILLDRSNRYNNIISLLDSERELQTIDANFPTGKGANSSVYKAVDPNEDKIDLVIKFCNSFRNETGGYNSKIQKRFKREIEALKKAKDNGKQNIINILTEGEVKIDDKYFLYYVMEYADSDLRQYLENTELSIQTRIQLCNDILHAVNDLHSIDIYHRDIKPDNFLMVGQTWKICDLGLIAHREEDQELDQFLGLLGPKGFMSPEATNKYYAYGDCLHTIDCRIDDKSDIYQLGKLFWYILQGDVPTGQLALEDFTFEDGRLFTHVIAPMLQYAKNRRSDIAMTAASLLPICREYAAI
jgi:serine/threonine protein kinase